MGAICSDNDTAGTLDVAAYLDSETISSFGEEDAVDGDFLNVTISINSYFFQSVGNRVLSFDCVDAAGNEAETVTRHISIVNDTTEPTLTLVDSSSINVPHNVPYVDPGVTCIDDLDGDISETIGTLGRVDVMTIGMYTITYLCVDNSGNGPAEITRIVNVVDRGLPTIMLIGFDTVSVVQNTMYIDQGATCIDAVDVSITPVINETAVDTDILGSYIVTYDCRDAAGNNAV